MTLEDLGYNETLENYRREKNLGSFAVGRVIAQHRERYIVKTAVKEYDSEVIGNLRFTVGSRADFPAVGDWVAISEYNDNNALIHALFPRKSVIDRQAPGKQGEKQIIAANIDYAFIVQAVDRDFNVNRIERYLTICNTSHVVPLIVLSKTDLISEAELNVLLAKVRERIQQVPVFTVSNESLKGVMGIKARIHKGATYCLLGSSGVGKSTLSNNLSGKQKMKTDAISISTGKGRHVTSHRELVILDNGGILIDNPGMREVGVTDATDGLDITFDHITRWAKNCRFKDCTHTTEMDCAVIRAVENGEIDRQSYESYLKMEREKEHFESTVAEKRNKDKIFGKMMKHYKKNQGLNRFMITLVLTLFSTSIFSQEDGIKSMILNHEDSKSVIISKGRKLLLDKFLEGDLKMVREIKDYLVDTEDDQYIAFYPAEYWFVLYWTLDYDELAKDIQRFDSARIESYNTRIQPYNDMLYSILKEKTFENESYIKGQIEGAGLDTETTRILTLNLDWLLLDSRKDIYAQDTLNDQADVFLETYPSSEYGGFAREFIRFRYVQRDWGVAFEFFTGYGIFAGSLSESYTHNIPLGVAFDVCYRNFELYLRDYIGFNKTKRDFEYSSGTWGKGSRAMVFLPEASLGYVTYNDNRFKVSPFAGIGAMNIGPTFQAVEETPELDEVELEFTTTYMIGFNFDLKFGSKNTPAFMPKTSYGFMRIRYAYNIPGFDQKYGNMTGNMHYITIGFGGMARGLKRQY